MSSNSNETPSRNNNNDEPHSPADSVVEVTACPNCGHLVPVQNMQLHQARHCQPQEQAVEQNQNEEAENRSTTAATNASRTEDDHSMQSRLQELRNSGTQRTSNTAAVASETQQNLPQQPPSAVAAASAPSMDYDLPYSTPDFSNAAAAAAGHPNSSAAISSSSRPGANALWDNLTSCFTGGSQAQPSSSMSTPQSDRKPPAQQRPSDNSMQVGDVVDLIDDDNDDDNNDQNNWACPRCTLFNPNDRSTCEACLAPRPHANTHGNVRPPDAVRRERLVPAPDNDNINNNMSPHTVYMSGGAVLGGLLGATGAYMRGRPVTSGVLEGAMSGAMGGAVLNEVMRDSNNNMNHATYPASQQTPPQRQPESHRPPPTPVPRRRLEPSRRRPGAMRVVRQQGPHGLTIITTSTGSNGNTVIRQMGGNNVPMMGGDPMMALMMQSLLQGGAVGNPNVDGMSYEQLLQAFGDGSENMGADEGQIRSLPTAVIDDPNRLPEDSRACAICLENFCKGETRKTLPCLHGFHESCVDRWLQTNGACPICKHRLNQS